MSSTTLYRKYRPSTFGEVLGQEHIVKTLSNSIANGRIGQAYLFTGPRGTGKTTFARILAKAVNCLDPKSHKDIKADACGKCPNCKMIQDGPSLDIFEIDAASNTGVDNIRELRETVKLPPSHLKHKVYIIDEVHMLSTGAFNALLKTLEEPPAHVIFILATTEIHKVPETIVSRCQRFDFSRLSLEHIVEKLELIAKSEKVNIEKDALEMIAIAAEGGMRDAESLLGQVISLEDKNITASEVEGILGTTKRQNLQDITTMLLAKDASGALALLNKLVADGYDVEIFNKSLVNYLRQLLLLSVDTSLAKLLTHELTSEQIEIIKSQASESESQEILRIISCFAEIGSKIKTAFIPHLPIEMAIIEATIKKSESPTQTGTIIPAPISASPAPQMLVKEAAAKKYEPTSSVSRTESAHTTSTSEYESKQTNTRNSDQGGNSINNDIKEKTVIIKSDDSEKPKEPSKFSIHDIRSKWNAITATMSAANMSLAALSPNCVPIETSGDVVILATRFAFYKDKIDDTKNKLTIEDAFGKIIGCPIRIKSVVDESYFASSEPKNDTPSQPRETSSLLTDAMGIMGGQIVE